VKENCVDSEVAVSESCALRRNAARQMKTLCPRPNAQPAGADAESLRSQQVLCCRFHPGYANAESHESRATVEPGHASAIFVRPRLIASARMAVRSSTLSVAGSWLLKECSAQIPRRTFLGLPQADRQQRRAPGSRLLKRPGPFEFRGRDVLWDAAFLNLRKRA
jgi:hypothetical protein